MRSDPLSRIERRAAIWWFIAMELVGFGATFAITQTIAAVGFPVFILLLIPVRILLLPRYFSPDELRLLDAPTASPFTMESVGGNHDESTEDLTNPSNISSAQKSGEDGPSSSADDEAERGQAPYFPEMSAEEQNTSKRSRRRSVRHNDEGDQIELAGLDR